jgi:hypothetical protein
LSAINTRALGKVNLYAGYGTDNLNMRQNQRFQLEQLLNG